MECMASHRDSLELLDSLARAISHQVRTPLSAITNEIVCLEAKRSSPELKRIKESCQRIGEMLTKSCALGRSILKLEPISLKRLLTEVFGEESLLYESSTFALGDRVKADRDRLRLGFYAVKELMLEVKTVTAHSAPPIRVAISLTLKKYKLTLDLLSELSEEVMNQPSAGSLSRFFNWQLGLDSTVAPLADAVFLAHGLDLHITPKNGLKLQLEIPRAVD
jgi:signal transduction histidine kinase